MNKEEKIINYIKKRCKPSVIILHGSRASGKNRENSDWDIIVFSNISKSIKDKIDGEYLDISIEKFPTSLKKYTEKYGYILYKGKILLDNKEKIGDKLVKLSKDIQRKGLKLTSERLKNRKLYMERVLARMEGTLSMQTQFFLHLSNFYQDSLAFWFQTRGKFSKPVYEAIVDIKKEDKGFFKLLEGLSSNSSDKTKLVMARNIYKRLFG